MSFIAVPDQDQVYQALESFLVGIVPSGVPVIRGLPNRAAMPPSPPGFVLIQALFESRLRMPIDTYMQGGDAPPSTYTVEQGIELPVQIDCYGKHSGTWASIISTLFEDAYGVGALAPNCAPLYCNEARMAALTNEEMQYEERWVLSPHLQWNPVVTAPQQYAGNLELTLRNATVEFPS